MAKRRQERPARPKATPGRPQPARASRPERLSQGAPARPFALFGAALDCLDDPERLSLRVASARAAGRGGIDLPADPFDALVSRLARRVPRRVKIAGKLPVPGHLRPRPPSGALAEVTLDAAGRFLETGGFEGVVAEVGRFVEREVFPARPAMVGVDHALSLGVLEALAGYAAVSADLALVVVDSHLDAVPLPARVPVEDPLAREADALSCGNWLLQVVVRGLLAPSRIVVLGVTDEPPSPADRPPEAERYAACYEAFVRSGVTVVPAREIRVGPAAADRALAPLAASSLYVSLDMDAASDPTHGACRFPAAGSLGPALVLATLERIVRGVRARGSRLAGFDIMETDVHMLGLAFPDGRRDETLDLLVESFRILAG